jgi:uncharacterized membrane protein YdcZ (DUF606 family)
MFKSYLTVAWRSLTRNKGYAAINIAGLATGMAIALLIGLWVADEMSYYSYNPGMPWWIFAAAGAGILLITLLTVSYQSLKAATTNPVRSLRAD